MKPIFWALLTAFTWGFVPIIEKFGLLKIPPMVGLFYRSLGVVLGLALLLLWQGRMIRESWADLHSGMLYLLIGGFLASMVGQIFFYMGLKNGQASMVVPVAASYPLITFLLGVLFLGEQVTPGKIAGLVAILIGIVLLK